LQHRKDGKLPNAKVQLVTATPVNLMIDDEYIERLFYAQFNGLIVPDKLPKK
jgi:hypothetical protein